MTALGESIRRIYHTSGHTSLEDWCGHVGVSVGTIRNWIRAEVEPSWLRTLRTIKRRTGLTWGEILDGHPWERRAVKMSKPDRRTDCATGHHECSNCGAHVSPRARYCEMCGAYFGEES